MHLVWKVVPLHTSKLRHPPPIIKIMVHLMQDSTTLLLMEKQAPGQLGLMTQISGFKWILGEMSKLQSSIHKDAKTTISGLRHSLFRIVLMVSPSLRHIKRTALIRYGEVS